MKSALSNTLLFWSLVAVLALAPLPLGSNRPFFWYANAFVVSVIAIIYMISVRAGRGRLHVPIRSIGVPVLLWGMAVVWMVVQVIPLPRSIPAGVRPLDGLGLPSIADTARISVDTAATLGMIVRYLTYGLICFLVLQVTFNPARARRLVQAVFWISVGHAAAGIVLLLELGDTLLFVPKWAYEGFATGFFVNRNSFATFVAFGIAAGTVLALDAFVGIGGAGGPSRRSRPDAAQILLVYGAGLAVLATAVVLSASRMGAFVSALGVVVAFVIALMRGKGRRGGIALGLIAIVVIGVAVLISAGGQLSDRLGSLESNLDDRLLLYAQVADMIKAHPWTGYGAGAFGAAFPLFHELPLSADVTWDSAHNLYLELFAELGFAAILPLLAVLFLVVQSIRALAEPEVHWVAPATAVCLTTVAAVHSLVDFSMQIEANVMIYMAVLAGGVAQAELVRRQSAHRARETSVAEIGGFSIANGQVGSAGR